MSRLKADAGLLLELAHALFAVEEKVDAAMQEAARFTAHLIEARGRAGLSIMVGQDALESVAASLGVLAQARREMVNTHNHLAVVQRKLGLGHVMVSPFDDKPPFPPPPPGGGGVTQQINDEVAVG